MITAERNGKKVTRNSSFFKLSPRSPEEIESSDEDDGEVVNPKSQEEIGRSDTPESDNANDDQAMSQLPLAVPVCRPHRERRKPAKFKDFIMKP